MRNTSAEFTQEQYRCLALAAAAQCALLVNQLATRGQANQRQLRACVDPLLVLTPDNVAQLYPDPAAFSDGLKAVQETLGGERNGSNADAVRYLLGITVLQQKLMKSPRLQEKVRSGLQHAGYGLTGLMNDTGGPAQNSGDPPSDALSVHTADFPFSAVAELYQKSISTLSYRIHVAGNPLHLRDKQIADQIRTLLLAGIRFAVLWHQMGGRRWHLLVYRKRIRDTITEIRRALLTVNVH